MLGLTASTGIGSALPAFSSTSVGSGITPIAMRVLERMSLVGAQAGPILSLIVPLILPAQDIFFEYFEHLKPSILIALAVYTCAAFRFSYSFALYAPAVIPYFRICYVYSFLMITKRLICSVAEASDFRQTVPLSLCSSLLMFKAIHLAADAGKNLFPSLAILSALPLITNILHRILKGNRFIAKCDLQMRRMAPIVYALPIALAMSKGSFAALAAAVAYVFLFKSANEIARGVWIYQNRLTNCWYVKCRQEADLHSPRTRDALKLALEAIPEGQSVYFDPFVFPDNSDAICVDEGLFRDNKNNFITSQQNDLLSLSLLLTVFLPCLEVVQTADTDWSLKINKEKVDFSNPRTSAVLSTVIKLSPWYGAGGVKITVNAADLEDLNVRETLQDIIAKGAGDRIMLPGFVINRNEPDTSASNLHILLDRKANGETVITRETLTTLQSLLRLSPKFTQVYVSQLSGGFIDASKIRHLPDENLLPDNWIRPAVAGWVSCLSFCNGVVILDNPPYQRLAIFDSKRVVSEERISKTLDESTLSEYCGDKIADIKGTSTPSNGEEWVSVLNTTYFAAHPHSSAKGRAISRQQREKGKVSAQEVSVGASPNPPVIDRLPNGQLIVRDVLAKWPSGWPKEVLDGPQTSHEVEAGVTLCWTKREGDGLIDHTGWSLILDRDLFRPLEVISSVDAAMYLFLFISRVRMGDLILSAYEFFQREPGSPSDNGFRLHIEPETQFEGEKQILMVPKQLIHGVITALMLRHQLIANRQISHVNIDGKVFERSFFSSEYLQIASSANPTREEMKDIHIGSLLESPMLLELCSCLPLVEDEQLGPFAMLQNEAIDFAMKFNQYITNSESVVITLENVDEWRGIARYAGCSSLERKCDQVDPDGKYHYMMGE
jgi:hypothetical protein